MVTRQRMMIVEGAALFNDKVSQLRTLVALSCGFPVGVFCLRTPDGLELYDCNFLRDYGLEPGTVPPLVPLGPSSSHWFLSHT